MPFINQFTVNVFLKSKRRHRMKLFTHKNLAAWVRITKTVDIQRVVLVVMRCNNALFILRKQD